MAFNFTPIVGGVDVLLTQVNLWFTKVAAILNSFPGSSIQAGTVQPAALQKPKGWFPLSWCRSTVLAGTSYTNIFRTTILNTDGASNPSYRINGWAVFCGHGATALTQGAGNQLLVKVANATVITIDLNAVGLSATTALSSTVAPIAVTSGQDISVDYVYGGVAASYPDLQLVLSMSVNHVST